MISHNYGEVSSFYGSVVKALSYGAICCRFKPPSWHVFYTESWVYQNLTSNVYPVIIWRQIYLTPNIYIRSNLKSNIWRQIYLTSNLIVMSHIRPCYSCPGLKKMPGPGFEPGTSCLLTQRSTTAPPRLELYQEFWDIAQKLTLLVKS